MWSEVTAALRQRVYRGQLSVELAARSLSALSDASIQRVTHERLYRDAFALASKIGWAKTYDAEYVVLAQQMTALDV